MFHIIVNLKKFWTGFKLEQFRLHLTLHIVYL